MAVVPANAASRSRGAIRPSFAIEFVALWNRGRREDRVRAAPAVSCAISVRDCAHEHTGSAEAIRPSLRDGLRLIRALLGEPCTLATVARARERELDTSVRVSGPHDFAVRFRRPRQVRHPRPPHPAPRRYVAQRPLMGRDGDRYSGDLYFGKAEYFFGWGWTGNLLEQLICPPGSHIRLTRRRFQFPKTAIGRAWRSCLSVGGEDDGTAMNVRHLTW